MLAKINSQCLLI